MNTLPRSAPTRAPVPLLAITVAVVVLLSACGAKAPAEGAAPAASASASAAGESKPAEGLQLSAEELQRAGIRTEEAQAAATEGVVTVTATIHPDPNRYARVAPRVEGRVLSVAVKPGDTVRAGQPLATLDSVAVGEAQSAYRQALAAHRVAEAEQQRARTLAADEIIPQRELLKAQGELDRSSAELSAAKDRLRLLGAAPGGGSTSDFVVRSPIAGTVVERAATGGALAEPATPLFVVADLSKLWIEANLTEDMLSRVHAGAAAKVTVPAYPGERFDGRVTYVAPVMDKETRTVAARIEVPNPGLRLKPEMFGTAEIGTGNTGAPDIRVPDAAVVLMQGQPTVFVQSKEGFEPRPVELGDKLAGRTVIRSGLRAGDQVVVAGTYALKARLLKSQISEE